MILWLGRQQNNYHGEQFVAAQERVKELGDPNFYAAQFPCGADGVGGVNGHPNAQNHREFADHVTRYLRQTVGIGL